MEQLHLYVDYRAVCIDKKVPVLPETHHRVFLRAGQSGDWLGVSLFVTKHDSTGNLGSQQSDDEALGAKINLRELPRLDLTGDGGNRECAWP